MKKILPMILALCISIIGLCGCNKIDDSNSSSNIIDLPNQEVGIQVSLEEYKETVEKIFANSIELNMMVYTTEQASTEGLTVGKKYITKSFWKDGACYDENGRLIWLYSNGYILEILNETRKYPINFDEANNADYLTIYMPTVNQVSDDLDFFLGLYYEEFNKATFDENQQIYTYVNDHWTDIDGNLSDIRWEFKFTEHSVTVRMIRKDITQERIYIMKSSDEIKVTEKVIFQDGFTFIERNDEYILIATPVVDNLYLPQFCNGKPYKVNFMALKCGRTSIFIPNTIKGFVLGINEYNWIYVQKILFAGTNDEWQSLKGVKYIKVRDELITTDTK